MKEVIGARVRKSTAKNFVFRSTDSLELATNELCEVGCLALRNAKISLKNIIKNYPSVL